MEKTYNVTIINGTFNKFLDPTINGKSSHTWIFDPNNNLYTVTFLPNEGYTFGGVTGGNASLLRSNIILVPPPESVADITITCVPI